MKKVRTVIDEFCDMCGQPSDVYTYEFTWDGRSYTLDACPPCSTEVAETMNGVIGFARREPKSGRRSQKIASRSIRTPKDFYEQFRSGRDDDALVCPWPGCGLESQSNNGFAVHFKRIHGVNIREYMER